MLLAHVHCVGVMPEGMKIPPSEVVCFLSWNWHCISVLFLSEWLFLSFFIGRFLSFFYQQIFFFWNIDQHAQVLNISHPISLFVPYTVGSIWCLSKRLEEATSWCHVRLALLCPHVWRKEWEPEEGGMAKPCYSCGTAMTQYTSIHACALLWAVLPSLWVITARQGTTMSRAWTFEDGCPDPYV